MRSPSTLLEPLPDEDFAGPCHYDLTLPAGKSSVRAVWVTYDRGRDIMKFYSDPSVVAFARRRHFALMMPHQCVGKNAPGGREEMDMDPTHGVGRALFTALDQLAAETGHPELSSAKLILLGFSGTGALFAHFVEFAPDRVLASIPANAGHYDPMGSILCGSHPLELKCQSWSSQAERTRFPAHSGLTITSSNIAAAVHHGHFSYKTELLTAASAIPSR